MRVTRTLSLDLDLEREDLEGEVPEVVALEIADQLPWSEWLVTNTELEWI